MRFFIKISAVTIILAILISGEMAERQPSLAQSTKELKWTPYEVVLCYPTLKPRFCLFYVEPKYINDRKSLVILGRHLTDWLPRQKDLSIYIYEKRESVVSSYFSDQMTLFRGSKGWYSRTRGKEVLLFAGEKNKIERVNIDQ